MLLFTFGRWKTRGAGKEDVDIMRQLAILVILVALLTVAAACGGEDEAPTPTPTSTPTFTPTTPTPNTPTPTPTPTIEEPTPTTSTVVLDISPVGDEVRFDKDTLTVSAGAEVVLRLNNDPTTIWQHNWVLVQNGTKDDVAIAGLTAGADNDYVEPGDARVFTNTRLLGPGETGEVRFTAPPVGTYQFVCTFPGHNMTMFGTFKVTP